MLFDMMFALVVCVSVFVSVCTYVCWAHECSKWYLFRNVYIPELLSKMEIVGQGRSSAESIQALTSSK